MSSFLEALRIQRWDDHRYYHHSRINQSLHLLSALSFLVAYGLIFKNPAASALIAWLVSMVSRQCGHFFFEPRGYDEVNHATQEHKEDIKVGYNLQRKIVLMLIWALSPALLWWDPTLFGAFPAHPDRTTFIQHVGQIWLAVGFGGLPIGVVCGRADLMRRFREERPADVCFARGTFNSHPYVMGAMAEFLDRLESPAIQAIYHELDGVWDRRAAALNERLREAGVQVRVANLSSVWTVQYLRPSRYNWMLQYYLRAEDLALSWVGTGRLIFSLDYTDAAFAAVADRFVAAARQMQEDGWWWPNHALTNRAIRRRVLLEMLRVRLRRPSDQSVAPSSGRTALDSKA